MDGFRHRLRAQRAVDLLGDERDERRGAFGEGEKRIIERGIRLVLVAVVLALPETAAAPADVPVREVLHKLFETVRRLLKMEGVHRAADLLDHVGERRENPAVERIGKIAWRLSVGRGLPAVDVRIGREEAERVPDRQNHRAHDLLDAVFGKFEVLRADNRRTEQEKPQRIRPVGLDDVHRVRIILETLGHLLPVFGQNHAVDDHIARGGLVEERGRKNRQRVEPSAGLVLPLRDEVGGEVLFKALLVFKGVMVLGIGHRTALEPAVENLGNARQDRSGTPFELDRIDEMLVDVADFLAGELFEFRDGTDADRLPRFTVAPDRQRASPVTVPADRPVARVLKPFAEASFLDVRRNPGHLLIRRQHLLLDPVDADKPG